jgi:predicted murein hydrolase (TIGR00659 family)
MSAWTGLIHSPLLGVTLTLGAYQASRTLWRRTHGHSLVNPVLVAIAVVGALLLLLHIPYADYMRGGQYVSFLLGPATVALAVPLHRQVIHIREAALSVALCVLVGSVAGIVVAIAATTAFGGDHTLALTMAPKSVTTPVAIALARSSGGVPELAAVFTILTGILGAVAAPAVLTLLRVRDQRIRGLAIGMSSHGIGTSQAIHESPLVGAFSALAMALNAVVTAVALPLILVLLR